MRKIALHIILLMTAVCHAQTDNSKTIGNYQTESNQNVENVNSESKEKAESAILAPVLSDQKLLGEQCDSIRPTLLSVERQPWYRPTLFSMWQPWRPFGGGGLWNLHEGFNAQIEAGVMVGFGKNNPFHGASFFTDISLMYALPVNDRWSLAIGGDVSRFRIWNSDVVNTRIEALANYKINDRLDATLYGIHTLAPLTSDSHLYAPFLDRCSSIGAGLTWKANESISLGISFEQRFYNEPMMPPPPNRHQTQQNGNIQNRR